MSEAKSYLYSFLNYLYSAFVLIDERINNPISNQAVNFGEVLFNQEIMF
jgi:hypothetical protein